MFTSLSINAKDNKATITSQGINSKDSRKALCGRRRARTGLIRETKRASKAGVDCHQASVDPLLCPTGKAKWFYFSDLNHLSI